MSGKRLTQAEWAAIVTKWELGTHTLKQLAEDYGVSLTAIKQGLNSRKAKRGCRAHEIAEQTAEEQKSARQKDAETATKIKEKFLKYTEALSSITMRKVMEQHAAKRPLEEIKGEMDALRKAATIIATMRDENFHLLGLYRDEMLDEDLPEIIFSEMTKEDLEAIQNGFEDEAAVILSDDDPIVDDPDSDDPELPFEEESK